MMETDSKARPMLAPGVRMQVDRVTHQPVLLYSEVIIELDAIGHAILQLCDGRNDIETIAGMLMEEYEIEATVLRADLADFLDELRQSNLVIFQP